MSGTIFDPPYPSLEDKDGDGKVTFERDDVPDSQKLTLRGYLRSLSEGQRPGETTGNPTSYDGQSPPNHANPFTISEDEANQSTFTSQEGLQDAIDRDAEPSQIFGDTSGIIRPSTLGAAGSTIELSGHELLAGVVGVDAPSGVTVTTAAGSTKYVETLGSALASKNLNYGSVRSNGIPITGDGSFSREEGIPTVSRVRLGDTLIDGSLSKSYDATDAKRVEKDDLFKIATKMMEAAVGGTQQQTGQSRVSSRVTRAALAAQGTSLEDLNRTTREGGLDSIPTGETETTGVYTERAWPVPYSPDNPYTGFESLSAAFNAFVTSLTFIVAVSSIAALGSVVPAIAKAAIPAEVNSGTRNARKLKSGKFRYVEQSSLLAGLSQAVDIASNLTGLSLSVPIYSPTNSLTDYASCVIAGLASFLGVSFGIDPGLIFFGFLNANTAIISAEIAVRLVAIAADPASRQYYMNIIRELNRDTDALGGALSSTSFAGNFISDVGAALGAVSSIFDSKLFRFVNTLAAIGDLTYTQTAAIDFRKTELEADPLTVYESYDPTANKNGQGVLMGGFGSRRIYGDKLVGRRGVSYSIADLPSYHLVPNGTGQAYRALLGDSNVAKRVKSVTPETVDGRLRFTPEQVSAIESTLESEYMPFYFQDLRTNEIVSFHAFLEDLSDSYSANYNKISGYGRVDEVKTYKDTSRSISFTFHIVATNPQDFNYMWWQINKLTTMVYPQWSKGRALMTDDNFTFTQPFSQIPTATPVMRVRVGDLIRSNYSRFNLKRLFGRQDTDKIESQTSELQTDITTETQTYGTGKYLVKAGESYESGRGGVMTGNVKLPTVDLFGEPVEFFIASKTQPSIGEAYYTIGGLAPVDIMGLSVWADESSGNVKPEIISVTLDGIKTISPKQTDAEFYDYQNNAVVRSFETTRGLGLAGVVTQLQFTWMDGLWGAGDDGPGNRAPRACKVQVSFEPIHDIAPGLDHEGFNRAPIYPVGSLINSIVEGNDPEPYGIGTRARELENVAVAVTKRGYEDIYKQGTLKKLF